ncbi:MAG: alginate O-acetyltransferase AlgX-related protein [Chthoniobacterales bacterium]
MPSSKLMSRKFDKDDYAEGWGQTEVSHRVAVWLSILFCAGLVTVPLVDGVLGSWRDPLLKAREGISRTLRPLVSGQFQWADVVEANNEALGAIEEFENSLEDSSALAAAVRPNALDALLRFGGAGSEEAYVGHDGWLFYRSDVDALTLHASENNRAASGIADFASELARRGIRLVVVPVPGKASIHPEKLAAADTQFASPPMSPSISALAQNVGSAWQSKEMTDSSLAPIIVDATELLWSRKLETAQDQFLRTDSHWTPAAMRAVSEKISILIAPFADSPTQQKVTTSPREVSATGDTALMLKLPPSSPLLEKQIVTIETVFVDEQEAWQPDRDSPVLVLGDSYANIYSAKDLGWGSSAGFAEQLSALLGAGVDKLSRNDAGAKSAREMLAAEAARNPDWLDGKKVVVWVMAAREFVRGDWSPVSLQSGAKEPAKDPFFVVPPGEFREVSARIVSLGNLPARGESPYADFLTAIHLTDLEDGASGEKIAGDTLAYLFTMRNHVVDIPPGLTPGSRVRLRLANYSDRRNQLDSLNRGDLEEIEVMMEEPNVAEWIDSQ